MKGKERKPWKVNISIGAPQGAQYGRGTRVQIFALSFANVLLVIFTVDVIMNLFLTKLATSQHQTQGG